VWQDLVDAEFEKLGIRQVMVNAQAQSLKDKRSSTLLYVMPRDVIVEASKTSRMMKLNLRYGR